jgi:hypothetical protein
MKTKIVHWSVSVLALTYGGFAWADETDRIQALVDESKKAKPVCDTWRQDAKSLELGLSPVKDTGQLAEVINLVDRYPSYSPATSKLFEKIRDPNLTEPQVKLAAQAVGCDVVELYDLEKAAVESAATLLLSENQKTALRSSILKTAENELEGPTTMMSVLVESTILNSMAKSKGSAFTEEQKKALAKIHAEVLEGRTELRTSHQRVNPSMSEGIRNEFGISEPLRIKLQDWLHGLQASSRSPS